MWKNGKSLSRGLRAALLCVCAAAALLAVGAGAVGWKKTADSLAGTRTRLASAEEERDRLEKTVSDAQSQLASEQERASELEARVSQLEERAAEAEAQNEKLEGENSALQAELDRVKKEAQTPAEPDGKKLIALTFDDGPGDTTTRLLDELKKRNMKATFFVVGNRVNRYASTLKRAADEGHEIGTHTYSHPNLTKLSLEEKAEEIQSSIQAITAITGKPVTLLRPPGGSYDDELKSYCGGQGLRIVYWSVDTRDWESHNKSSILSTAFQEGPYGIRNGAIVLMHDIYTDTVDAAVEMMDRLQKEGYTTVTVSELLQLRKNGGVAGEVYVSAPPQ
ncbi:MAG TPA: polysaccharide deacetylase family protein [Firmicutes bacterium]|nr:polysaccharide deacetylase family protein [Bacillota bacterium]